MPLVSHIFREYDIRGLMDKEINPLFVRILGRVLAKYFKEKGHSRIIIGYDTRHNSIEYHDILCEELNKNDCDVISLGMIPSPCLYFATQYLQIFAGIMVTASHNDAPYNGFKIWQGKSTLYGESIQEIYKRMLKTYEEIGENTLDIENDNMKTMPFLVESTQAEPTQKKKPQNKDDTKKTILNIQGISSFLDIKTPYTKNLCAQIGQLSCKVVVDGSNASAGELCCDILQKMGVDCISLYCEPTSDFPNHPPDPTIAENCKELCKQVIQHKADFGIGLDGDGDRLIMVDRNARILACDELLSLFAQDILLRIPNARILADVKCTHHLFKEIEALGGIAIMAPTGHSLMKAAMQKEKAHIGGELSGHFFHAENWFGTDDGILTAVRALAILRDRNWDLTQFPKWEKSYATPEIRFDCPENKKIPLIQKAQEYYSAKYGEKFRVSCMDGLRVDFGSAWFLIRASHTSATLTLRFEAESENALAKLKNSKIEKLESWLNALS